MLWFCRSMMLRLSLTPNYIIFYYVKHRGSSSGLQLICWKSKGVTESLREKSTCIKLSCKHKQQSVCRQGRGGALCCSFIWNYKRGGFSVFGWAVNVSVVLAWKHLHWKQACFCDGHHWLSMQEEYPSCHISYTRTRQEPCHLNSTVAKKRELVISAHFKSLHLWWYEGALVPEEWRACTFVKAWSVVKHICRYYSSIGTHSYVFF